MRHMLVFFVVLLGLLSCAEATGRKRLLAIGDSVTAARQWQRKVGELLDMDVRSHCKGGVGILAMVDGDGAGSPPQGYDPDTFGVERLFMLSEKDVADIDLVLMMGFYNERHLLRNGMRGKSGSPDANRKTFCGRLDYAVCRVREELEKSGNSRAQIVLVSPHCYGKYPRSDADGCEDGPALVSAIREVAQHNRIPFVDVYAHSGIARENWNVYHRSASPFSKNYLTGDGKPNVGVDNPFATLETAPDPAGCKGKYITVRGVPGSFRSDGVKWVRGSVSAPWNGDQLHPNRKGHERIGETIAKELKRLGVVGDDELRELTPWEQWGGLRAHPAVVNPVGRDAGDDNVLSLRGEWDFRTTRPPTYGNSPLRAIVQGRGGFWRKEGGVKSRDGELRSLRVPGCWEMQGVGASETSHPCFVKWDVLPKPMRHCYQGVGWYRKSVEIPASWTGRRIWLKTGWANSVAKFWVNGEPVAYENTFCGTYKYDVSEFVTPGSNAMVVVEVMNTVPSRRGGCNSVNHWGGIWRDIEFESTPMDCYIDDAWVRGDFDKREATVHVAVEKVEGVENVEKCSVRVTVEGETGEVAVHSSPSPSDFTLEVPLRHFRPWSPEHPNLYWATIELLKDGQVVQTRRERFGVRKLEVRGEDFFLNGRPFYMRGAGWHFVHPVEGVPLADREIWLSKAKKVRAAGFNIVRTHTMCNMPEFYEACDEVGLMVEPEIPYYTDVQRDGQAFDPVGDARELYEHFRRYPSFCVYSGGNEGWFGTRLTRWLFRDVRSRDPDRLMVGQDTWMNDTNNQHGMTDFSGGPMTVWPRGTVRSEGLPFVCHEYLNLCIKLDARIESKYTGVYEPPVTRAQRVDWLGKFGLGQAWGDDLQDAQHALQSVWRKYGFEAARTDPYCDGYSYWSLQDCASPQKGSYSAQALFDPFWDVKPKGDAPADVAVYNSASCLLLSDACDPELWETPERELGKFEMFADGLATNRVRSAGELIRARFHLAHYGDEPLDESNLKWRLVADGRDLASGALAVGRQALGAARVIGSVDIRVPDVDRACRSVLAVDVGGVTNSWPYWLFPARNRSVVRKLACADGFRSALSPRYDGLLTEADWRKADTVIAPFGGDLEREALAAGKSVVALANQTGKADVYLGWWWMGDQMGAAIKEHPALEAFPHQGVLNQLFFRIGKTGLKLPVEGVCEKDLVMVGEGAEACFLYLADVPCPGGAHRFVIAGLDVLSDTAEGTALLDGVLRQMKAFSQDER